MKRYLAVAAAGLCGLLSLGCQPPKYALYTSPNRDFQCNVPWAWNVMFDSAGKDFTNVTFIGPFEPDFYLGAPSFSVRWYARYGVHRLRDNSLEMYGGPEEFIKKTLDEVYGPNRSLDKPQDVVPAAFGRAAKSFVVRSLGPVDPKARWGVRIDETSGQSVNPRQHAYVVITMPGGFYVLVYPATLQGFKLYEAQFNQLVNSFKPLKDGPGGSAILPPAAKKPFPRSI